MTEPWHADDATLAALRAAPQPLAPPIGAGRAGRLVLDVAWAPAAGRRVLVHRGDLRGDGWAAWFADGRPWVRFRRGATARGWRGPPVRRGWHRLALAFDVAGTPVGATLDGVALPPATFDPPDDMHGEVPASDGAVLGGARDRAGGHTNLRYGERPGEMIVRCVWHEGVDPAPGGSTAPRPTLPTAPPTPPIAPRVGVRVRSRVAAGVRHAWVEGAPAGATVWWDLGDAVVAGREAAWPEPWVRRPVAVHLADAAGVRRLRPPRAAGVHAVPVFRPGDGGYAAFRIPAIVRAADGTLLAFAEGRRESVSDSCRTKHLVLRRSADDGRTWGPLAVAAALPEGPGVRSLMNPSPVVDTMRGTGRVVLVHSRLDADEWRVAAGEGRARLRAVISDDHGRTWTEIVDVAAQLGHPQGLEAAWVRPGPWRIQVGTLGHGLQLRHGPHRGRLCFAGHGTFGAASVFDAVGFLFWSDDLGRTWQVGPALAHRDDGTPARGPNEATLTERPDGRVLVNARHYRDGRPAGHRAVAEVGWTADGRAVPGPVRTDPALVDSGVQGSLLALPPDADAPEGRLLFCNPAHPTARLALTLRESRDRGATWPRARLLVAGRSGYSDLVVLEGGVGVLFEDGADGAVSFVAAPLPGAGAPQGRT